MIRESIILIPGVGEEPLSYLFRPVAGVPFLSRQVLGLRRVGIETITLVASSDLSRSLNQERSRHPAFFPGVKIISRWSDYTMPTAESPGGGYFLTLVVNILPDQHLLKAFFQNTPPPGALVLGVIEQQRASAAEIKFPAKEPDIPSLVSLNNGLVVSLGSTGSAKAFQSVGLTLFSQEAWKDWHEEAVRQDTGSPPDPNSPVGNLYAYVARKITKDQVLGVVLDPSGFVSVYHDRDRAAASARLVAAQNNSPVGEGILENAWNRKIARWLLPWFLNLRITPNQITFLTFLVGLLAAWGFAQGSYGASVGAALLLPLILVMDCLDGALARLKFLESRLGALLDLHGDTVLNLLLLLGITLGSYRSSGHPLFLTSGLLLIVGYLACWYLLNPTDFKPDITTQSPRSQTGSSEKILEEAVSRDFFYIILLMAILNWLDWMILGIAIGTNIFALFIYWRKSNG